MNKPHIVVSLDMPDSKSALALANRLSPADCRLKVGKELFTSAGPSLLEALQKQGYRIFLDLKYHDIPNTVAKACAAAAALGVWMINVHAMGGRAMLRAAREALDRVFAQGDDVPLLVAVTVLTSLRDQDLRETGVTGTAAGQVNMLASLAHECGLDGVVCSAREITMLRKAFGRDFCLVTPGIRPRHADLQDQKRVMTPAQAIQAGSDYLVIGRPITQAERPERALAEIQRQMDAL